MKKIRFIYKYFKHFFSAKHTRGFRIHSPFIYNFTCSVIYEKKPFYIFSKIETLRQSLLKNNNKILVTDFGTDENREKTIKSIAARSLKTPKFGQLFFRIANYLGSKEILELGTSLGITTSYLAAVSADIRCTTMEGCPQTSAIAADNFKQLQLNNINLIVGNIDEKLTAELEKAEKLDFVFIDANHRYEPLMRYFEQILPKLYNKSVLIIDDLYWSADMEKAWEALKNHPRASATIDLFQVGIIFLNPELNKIHYKMRF